MMKTILCILVLAMTSPVFAQPGSGSGSAGSGSAAPAAGSGAPAAGSGSAAADAPAAGSGSAPAPAPDPGSAEPNPEARKACVEAMNADPAFADRIIKTAEVQLRDKLDAEQVTKDICTLRDHSDSQADVAKNKKHVLMAYIAMWLVAAGFVIFMWRKQQSLKLEIAKLRADLEAATKDGK